MNERRGSNESVTKRISVRSAYQYRNRNRRFHDRQRASLSPLSLSPKRCAERRDHDDLYGNFVRQVVPDSAHVECDRVEGLKMSTTLHEFSTTRYSNPAKIPDSIIAKEYARASGFAISWVNFRVTRYGFRLARMDAPNPVILESYLGVSSYLSLYKAMLKYVASKREVSK
jgi:hypothetical protein